MPECNPHWDWQRELSVSGALPRGQKKILHSLLIPGLENNSSVLSNIPNKAECIQSLMLSEIPIHSGPREEHRPCDPRSSHCGLYIRRCDWRESKKLVANCCKDMQDGSSSGTVSTQPREVPAGRCLSGPCCWGRGEERMPGRLTSGGPHLLAGA